MSEIKPGDWVTWGVGYAAYELVELLPPPSLEMKVKWPGRSVLGGRVLEHQRPQEDPVTVRHNNDVVLWCTAEEMKGLKMADPEKGLLPLKPGDWVTWGSKTHAFEVEEVYDEYIVVGARVFPVMTSNGEVDESVGLWMRNINRSNKSLQFYSLRKVEKAKTSDPEESDLTSIWTSI